MRLIYTSETPVYVGLPPLGYIKKGDIVDVLGKDEIASLKEIGFEKAPPFKGEAKEEEVNNG